MMGAFGGAELLIMILIYLLPILFVLWLALRFVRAHEDIADGIRQIANHLRHNNPR